MPDMTPVRSSNIAAIGYDDANSHLYVYFHAGARYRYSGVPSGVYEAFLAARSKGEFLWDRIRDRYPARRLR